MNHHRRRALGAAALAVSLAVITATQPGAAGTAGYERIVFSSPLPGGGASVSVVSPDGSGWVGVDLAVDLEDFNRTVWSHDGTRLLHGLDISFGESPKFNGKAVVALATDPDVIQRSGGSFFTGALAREYGFTEDDGSLPPLTESGLMSLMDSDDIPEYWRGVDRYVEADS